MKRILFLLIPFLLTSLVIAQPGRHKEGGNKKIRQLEKIKLIEALDMNEETTLKFFARKNEMENDIDSLKQEVDEIISEMEESISGERELTEVQKSDMIKRFVALHNKMEERKNEFISSLDDILTNEQIITYLVFERKFHREIRKLLFKERRENRRR